MNKQKKINIYEKQYKNKIIIYTIEIDKLLNDDYVILPSVISNEICD